MKNNSLRLGPLILTTFRQADGAPIIDSCLIKEPSTKDSFNGWAILVKRPLAFGIGLKESWFNWLKRLFPNTTKSRQNVGRPMRLNDKEASCKHLGNS